MLDDDNLAFGFPFRVDEAGGIGATTRDETLRGKIVQILFTAPGERVNHPEFGCGLFNLVFNPNSSILAAAMEFTVGQALLRWLGDEIAVDGVDIQAVDEVVVVEISYITKADLSKQIVRIQFK